MLGAHPGRSISMRCSERVVISAEFRGDLYGANGNTFSNTYVIIANMGTRDHFVSQSERGAGAGGVCIMEARMRAVVRVGMLQLLRWVNKSAWSDFRRHS